MLENMDRFPVFGQHDDFSIVFDDYLVMVDIWRFIDLLFGDTRFDKMSI